MGGKLVDARAAEPVDGFGDDDADGLGAGVLADLAFAPPAAAQAAGEEGGRAAQDDGAVNGEEVGEVALEDDGTGALSRKQPGRQRAVKRAHVDLERSAAGVALGQEARARRLLVHRQHVKPAVGKRAGDGGLAGARSPGECDPHGGAMGLVKGFNFRRGMRGVGRVMAKATALEELTLESAIEPLPATLRDDATLSEALGKMKEKGLHELAVVGAKGQLIGLISDETLLRRRRLPLQTNVSNLLVVPPRLTVADSLARGAEALLANGFRELPVFDAGGTRIAGQVTRWRLLELLKMDPEICALPAHSVMTPDPVVARTSDTIEHAIDEMRRLDEPTLPVVDEGGDLVGVVSARDILRKYAGRAAQGRVPKGSPERQMRANITVDGLMTTPVVEAPRDTTVEKLADLMIESRASSVVITDGGKPKGVVTKGDLIELIASLAPRDGVFLQITGLENHDPFIVEDVFAQVEPAMQKMAAFARPVTFNLHVSEHHRDYGHRAEVRARLLTDRGLFTATDEGDDLMRAVSGVLERLEKQIHREKDRSRPSPRKARSGMPPAGPSKLT